ncbi:HTH-type transcriptional regulator DmlR [compost metagenome]
MRITNDLDPNLIARKLAVCRSVVCASPDYLAREGVPARIEDLSLRNCLTHSYFGKSLWRFERNGEPVDVPVSGSISANEVSVLASAAVQGAGIAMLPTYYAADLVASGRLQVILPQCKPQELGIYGVYASRRQMPLILRSMLDFLVERLGSTPWDQGQA